MTDVEYVEKEIKQLKSKIGDRYLKNDVHDLKQLTNRLDKMQKKLKELQRC